MKSPAIEKYWNKRFFWSAALVGIFIAWMAPTLFALHRRWSSAAIEYSYLIVFISTFLLYREFRKAPSEQNSRCWFCFVVFAASVGIVFLSNIIAIVLVPQLLFPVMVVAIIGMIAGSDLARRSILPLGFLYFSIPFWQAFDYVGWSGIPLNETLRQITTVVATAAVSMTGIPALIDGDTVVLSTGSFEIAEGCSGRAYFITALELSAFYALAFLRSNRHRVILVVVACSLALVGNWIRVFSLIMIGYLSDMQHRLVWDHADFGWVVFILTTMPFLLVGRWLESVEEERGGEEPHQLALPDRAYASSTTAVVLSLALISAAFIAQLHAAAQQKKQIPVDWDLSASGGVWQSLGKWPDESVPIFPGASSQMSARYANGQQRLRVFVADYPFQNQNHEVVHFDNRPIRAESIRKRGEVRVDVAGSEETLEFEAYETGPAWDRVVTWIGYRVAGRPTADRLTAKQLQIRGFIRGRYDAQVYILAAQCQGECEQASDAIHDFVAGHGATIFQDVR